MSDYFRFLLTVRALALTTTQVNFFFLKQASIKMTHHTTYGNIYSNVCVGVVEAIQLTNILKQPVRFCFPKCLLEILRGRVEISGHLASRL